MIDFALKNVSRNSRSASVTAYSGSVTLFNHVWFHVLNTSAVIFVIL